MTVLVGWGLSDVPVLSSAETKQSNEIGMASHPIRHFKKVSNLCMKPEVDIY